MEDNISMQNTQDDSNASSFEIVKPPMPPPLPTFVSRHHAPLPLPPPLAPPLPSITGSTLNDLELTFRPTYFFFYGSLMDSEVLQTVLSLPVAPQMEEGRIEGFKVKMWGIYPALIKAEGGEVDGTVWKVSNVAHLLRLAEYETGAYATCACEIIKSDGELIRDGRTFCWAGDPGSKELDDGNFDFARYQKYFKPSVVRKSGVGSQT